MSKLNKQLEKQLEKKNIFISVVFQRNANREPQWYYVIDDLENQLHKSGIYGNKMQCKNDAIHKAFILTMSETDKAIIKATHFHCLKVAANKIRVSVTV